MCNLKEIIGQSRRRTDHADNIQAALIFRQFKYSFFNQLHALFSCLLYFKLKLYIFFEFHSNSVCECFSVFQRNPICLLLRTNFKF